MDLLEWQERTEQRLRQIEGFLALDVPSSPADGESQPTTTQASKEARSDADFEEWAAKQREQAFMSPGSRESSSPPKIPGSSLQPGDLLGDLFHAATCLRCAAQLGALLARFRMHALGVSGPMASTSASEATSSSVAPKADRVPFGSNRLSDGPTDFDDPRRCRSMIAGFSCIRWSGHKDGHAMTWDDELAAATNEGREVDYGPPGSQARDGWSEHGPARTAAGHLQA